MKPILGENFPLRANILIGISVVVGAASGIYLLTKSIKYISQLSDKRLRKKRNEEPCNVCCVNLDSENIKICVKCINCQKIACRGQDCSTWIPSRSGWECQLCNHSNESCSKSSEWLHQQITGRFLSPLSARAEPTVLRDSYPIAEVDGRSETASSFGGDQKERVRELVEETLGDMLGGSLNNVSIGQLYKSRDYLPTWENGDCPGVSHVKLKRLIERIVQETLRLPSVTDQPNNPGSSGDENLPFFDPKKYQELLATAVLNKIVDSYNYEKKFEGNREATSTRLDLDKNHNALICRKEQSGSVSSSSIEPESDWSITDPPTNISRCDDFSRSDSGSNLFSDILNRNDQRDSSILNDYIAKHKVPLPDFSIASDSSNEDIQDSVTSACAENTWDRNWLFKKKRSGQDGSGPVGMLVPCPKEDIKTQIGDRTADELSDLSEAGSDFDDEDHEMTGENPPNVRIQNRCVIGGKSPVGLFDELLEQTSLISSSSLADGDAVFTETKNDFVLGDDLHNDVGQSSAFDAGEAVNSLVDTKNLRENLSNSKQVQDDSLISESSRADDLGIERPPVAKPRSKKKVTQTIFISTKDIPDPELTTSSVGSSVHNSGNLCEELSSSPTQTTNPTNNNNIEEQLPQLPSYTTQPSVIQFLAVYSLAPSLAVTSMDVENIDNIIRISHSSNTLQSKSESFTGFDISGDTELSSAVDIGTPDAIQVDVLTESKNKIQERSEQPQSPVDLEISTQSSSAVRSEQNSEQSVNSKIELDFDGLIPPPMEFGTECFDLEIQNPEVPVSIKIEMHLKSELHVPVEDVPEANEELSTEKKEIKKNKPVEESVESGNEKTVISEELTPDSFTSTLSKDLESQLKPEESVQDYDATKLEEVRAAVQSAFERELLVATQDQPLNESQGFNPELMNQLIQNESQGQISVNQVTVLAGGEEMEFSINLPNPKSEADLAIQEVILKVIPEEFLEREVPETSECKTEGSEYGIHLKENEVKVTLKEDECKNNESEQKTLPSTYPDIENICSSCEASIQSNEPTEELISSLSAIASTENNASSEIIESNFQNSEKNFEEPTQQIAVESTNSDEEFKKVSEMLLISSGTGVFCSQDEEAASTESKIDDLALSNSGETTETLITEEYTNNIINIQKSEEGSEVCFSKEEGSNERSSDLLTDIKHDDNPKRIEEYSSLKIEKTVIEGTAVTDVLSLDAQVAMTEAVNEFISLNTVSKVKEVKDARDDHGDEIVEPVLTLETEDMKQLAAKEVDDAKSSIEKTPLQTEFMEVTAEFSDSNSTVEATTPVTVNIEDALGVNDSSATIKEISSEIENIGTATEAEVKATNMAAKAEDKYTNSEVTSTENKNTLATQGVNDSSLKMEKTPPETENMEASAEIKDANLIEKDDISKDHVSTTVIVPDEIIENTVLTLTKPRNGDQNQIESIRSFHVSSNDPTIDEELPPDCMDFSIMEPSEQSLVYFEEKCLKSIEITPSSSEKVEDPENLEMSLLDDEKPPDCIDFTSLETPPPTYEEISTGSCAELQARHNCATGHVEKKSKIPIKIKTEAAKQTLEENKKTITGSSKKEETVCTTTIKIPFSEENVGDVFDIDAIAPPAEFQCPDINEDYEDQSIELTSANPSPTAETDCKHDFIQSKENVSEPKKDIRLNKASDLCEETVSIDIRDTLTKSSEAEVNKVDSISLESDENLERIELQEGLNVEAQVEIREHLSKSELLEDEIQFSKEKEITQINESNTEKLLAIITKEVDASKNEEILNEAGHTNLTEIENPDQPLSELAESNTSEEIEASKPPDPAEYTTNLKANNTQNTTSAEHSYNIPQSSRHEEPIAETSMKRIASEHEFIMEMESDLFHFAEAVCDDNFEDVEDDFEDFFMSQESIEIIDPRKMADLSRTIITETVQRKPTGTVKKLKRGVLSKDEILQQPCEFPNKEKELLNEASSDLADNKKTFSTNEVAEREKITKMKRDRVDSLEIVEVVGSTSMVRRDTDDSIKIENTINLHSESKLEELNQLADAAIIITNQTEGSNKSTCYKEPFKNSRAQTISLNEDDVAQVTNDDQSAEESKVRLDHVEEKDPLDSPVRVEQVFCEEVCTTPKVEELTIVVQNALQTEERPSSSELINAVNEELKEEVYKTSNKVECFLEKISTSIEIPVVDVASKVEQFIATIDSPTELNRSTTAEEEICEEESTPPNPEELAITTDIQSEFIPKPIAEEKSSSNEDIIQNFEELAPIADPQIVEQSTEVFTKTDAAKKESTTQRIEELVQTQNEIILQPVTEEDPGSCETKILDEEEQSEEVFTNISSKNIEEEEFSLLKIEQFEGTDSTCPSEEENSFKAGRYKEVSPPPTNSNFSEILEESTTLSELTSGLPPCVNAVEEISNIPTVIKNFEHCEKEPISTKVEEIAHIDDIESKLEGKICFSLEQTCEQELKYEELSELPIASEELDKLREVLNSDEVEIGEEISLSFSQKEEQSKKHSESPLEISSEFIEGKEQEFTEKTIVSEDNIPIASEIEYTIEKECCLEKVVVAARSDQLLEIPSEDNQGVVKTTEFKSELSAPTVDEEEQAIPGKQYDEINSKISSIEFRIGGNAVETPLKMCELQSELLGKLDILPDSLEPSEELPTQSIALEPTLEISVEYPNEILQQSPESQHEHRRESVTDESTEMNKKISQDFEMESSPVHISEDESSSITTESCHESTSTVEVEELSSPFEGTSPSVSPIVPHIQGAEISKVLKKINELTETNAESEPLSIVSEKMEQSASPSEITDSSKHTENKDENISEQPEEKISSEDQKIITAENLLQSEKLEEASESQTTIEEKAATNSSNIANDYYYYSILKSPNKVLESSVRTSEASSQVGLKDWPDIFTSKEASTIQHRENIGKPVAEVKEEVGSDDLGTIAEREYYYYSTVQNIELVTLGKVSESSSQVRSINFPEEGLAKSSTIDHVEDDISKDNEEHVLSEEPEKRAISSTAENEYYYYSFKQINESATPVITSEASYQDGPEEASVQNIEETSKLSLFLDDVKEANEVAVEGNDLPEVPETNKSSIEGTDYYFYSVLPSQSLISPVIVSEVSSYVELNAVDTSSHQLIEEIEKPVKVLDDVKKENKTTVEENVSPKTVCESNSEESPNIQICAIQNEEAKEDTESLDTNETEVGNFTRKSELINELSSLAPKLLSQNEMTLEEPGACFSECKDVEQLNNENIGSEVTIVLELCASNEESPEICTQIFSSSEDISTYDTAPSSLTDILEIRTISPDLNKDHDVGLKNEEATEKFEGTKFIRDIEETSNESEDVEITCTQKTEVQLADDMQNGLTIQPPIEFQSSANQMPKELSKNELSQNLVLLNVASAIGCSVIAAEKMSTDNCDGSTIVLAPNSEDKTEKMVETKENASDVENSMTILVQPESENQSSPEKSLAKLEDKVDTNYYYYYTIDNVKDENRDTVDSVIKRYHEGVEDTTVVVPSIDEVQEHETSNATTEHIEKGDDDDETSKGITDIHPVELMEQEEDPLLVPLEFTLDSRKTSEISESPNGTSVPSSVENRMDGNLTETEKVSEQNLSDEDNENDISACLGIDELAESILPKNLSKSEEIEKSSNIVVEEIAKDNEPDTSNTTDTIFTNEELDMVASKEDITILSTLESRGVLDTSSTESSEKFLGQDSLNSCNKACPIASIVSEASAIDCQTVENSEIKRDFDESCNLEETNNVTNISIQIKDTPSKIEANSHEEQSENFISDSPLVEACIIVAEDSHSDVDSSLKRVPHLKQLSYELPDDHDQEKQSTDMSFDADSLDQSQDDETSSLEFQENLMTDISQDLAKSSTPVKENEGSVLMHLISPVSETHHESIPQNPVALEKSQIVESDSFEGMKLCTKHVCTEGTASDINEVEGLNKVNETTSTEDQDTKKIHNNEEQEQDNKPGCYLGNASSPDTGSLKATIEKKNSESFSKNEQPIETESDFESNQNEDPDDSDFVIKGHIMEEEYKDDDCFIENFTEYSSPTISEDCEFTDSMDSASLNEEEEIEATSESQIKFYCEESLTKTNYATEELAANKIVEYTEAIPTEINYAAETYAHGKMVREYSIEYGVDAFLMGDLTSFSDPTIEILSDSQQEKGEEQCAEYSPDSLECGEPELSVTPPELSLSYMTPTYLEAIPEDFELSESPPKLTFKNIETNEDTSQNDSSSIESQDQYDEETIQGNYQEFPIDTTQQEEINTLSYSQTTTSSDIDLISPSVVFSLSADRTMSTESSTTSDDTVKTAIEKAGQLDIENPSVDILHKDLFPVPMETYSVTLSLQLIDNNLNNTNQEDFSMAQNSNATSTTTTSSTTLNGSSLKQQHSKFEILKSSAFSAQLSDEEDVVGHLSHLLPGSIAEREHKKWYNAVDMPNNPYSKEALKRRLSGTSDKTFDMPNINSTLEKAASEDALQSGEETEISREEVQVDYKRYGRDYYINDAKHASGMSRRSLTASSPFLSSIEDDKVSDKEISETPTPQPIPRSHSWGDKRCDTADIFAARPVRVEESDPILSKATKLEYLSTPDRDFYLLPTEEISSLRSISTSERSLSQAGDSLTPSEDSDTIRVYDLKTQETRLLLRDDQVNLKSTIGTNTSGSFRQQEGLRSPLTSAKSPVQNRTVTPSALKFLQPKRKLFNSRLIMSEDNTSSTAFDRENIVRSNGTPEKSVIEEDVVSSLPSVRALAKAFQNASKDSSAPVNRPKIRYRMSSSWKSLDIKSNSEQISSTPIIAEQSSPKTPSNDSFIPPYEQKYTPAESTETGTTVVEEKVNGTCCVSDEKLNEHEANASELSEQDEVKPASPQPLAVHFAEKIETEQQPPSPGPVKTIEEPIPSPAPVLAEESIPTPSTVEENVEEVPTPQIPQVTSTAIETPPEQEECEPNSLEWKEENMEIVDKDHLPIPQDDQPKEADPADAVSVEPATPTPAERIATHSTPPNTPNPPEDEEEKEQVTLIAPTSCPVVLDSVTPVEDETTPEPATPLITPTSIQFEQNDEEKSTPVQHVLEIPPTSVQQPLENGDDKPTLNGSHDQNASPTQEPEVSIAEPKSPEEPIQTSLSQPQQPEQQSEPATTQNDVPKISIVEEKRSEIRFTQESPTRERPISPVLVPGKLKSSIAFFENLKNNK